MRAAIESLASRRGPLERSDQIATRRRMTLQRLHIIHPGAHCGTPFRDAMLQRCGPSVLRARHAGIAMGKLRWCPLRK